MIYAQLSLILPNLLLPFFIMLLKHPLKSVSKISRFFSCLSIVVIVASIPMFILIKLKYWTFLLLLIPILFRAMEVVINKIQLSDYIKLSDKKLNSLLFTSMVCIFIIFLLANYNYTSYGLWISFILIISRITDFYTIRKYNLLVGLLFGPILTVMPPFKSANTFTTYAVIWGIFSLLSYVLSIIRFNKFLKTIEENSVVLIVPIALLIILSGGIPIMLPLLWGSMLTLFYIFTLIIPDYIIQKRRLPLLIKHYSIVIITICLFTSLSFLNRITELSSVINQIIILLSPLFLLIILGRLLSPILQNVKTRQFITMDEIFESLVLILGNAMGKYIFRVVYGKDYKLIKCKHAIFILACISVGLFSISFHVLNLDPLSIINNSTIYNPVIILAISFNSIICALTFFTGVSELFNRDSYSKGLPKDMSFKISCNIVNNYFMIIISLLLINYDTIKNIGIIGLLIIGYMFFTNMFNISLTLHFDLQIKNYNDLRKTRYMVSIMLQAIGIFVLIFYVLYFWEIQINNKSIHLSSITYIFYYIFVSGLVAKLIGYDTYWASKKMMKQSRYILFIAILPFIIAAIDKSMSAFVYYLSIKLFSSLLLIIFNDKIITLKIIYFSLLSYFWLIFSAIATLIIPSTNELNDSLFDSYVKYFKDVRKNKEYYNIGK